MSLVMAGTASHRRRRSRGSGRLYWPSVNPLELIVDAVPALIAYVDRDQRYGFANQADEAWFGRPRGEIPGPTLRQFLGEARNKEIQPYVERVLAGEGVTFESTVTHRDGTRRFVRAVDVPDPAPGGTGRGYISLVGDITDDRAQVGRRCGRC